MRIVHWYQNFLGGGGVANATLALANAQSRLGHDVLLMAMEAEQPPLYESLVQHLQCAVLTWKPRIRLRYGRLDLAVPEKKAIERLNRWRPYIVHIHGEFLPGNIWLGRQMNCPMVLTPHGAFHPRRFDSANGKRLLRRNLYVRLAAALLYKRLRGLHALSLMEESQIRKMIPGANVYCVPQGPAVQMGLLSEQDERESFAQTPGQTKLIFVGRLDIHTKGLDILLPAFAQTIRRLRLDNISLSLVGPDWKGGRSALQEMADQLGIRERVEFTGPKSSRDVAKLLREADLFVFLSRHEGFSLSLTEALIAGIPSIVSTEAGNLSFNEVSSLPYIYPVKPVIGDATEAMAYCIPHLEDLRKSAAQFVPQAQQFFDWSRIAMLHIQRYREFVNGSGTEGHNRSV